MAKEYITVNGKLLMTDNKLVQVPDSENLNDLADVNNLTATLMSNTVNEVEDLIVNGVIDGSPKGVYTNLSALQSAFPNGASGVYITRDDGHWYFWDGSAWTDGGVYQTPGDYNELKEGLDDIRTKENLEPENVYNPAKATFGYMTMDGTIGSSTGLKYTEKIPVVEGDIIRIYRLEYGELQSYACRFITAFNGNDAISSKGAQNTDYYTVPSGVDGVVLTVSAPYSIEITKNLEATTYTEYFEPYSKIQIKENTLQKASQTVFGVVKMWTTEDENGNSVLNISTED